MKALILQLARHGDIVQTWPALNALRREKPSAELHLLVRERYSDATLALHQVDQVWPMSSEQILSDVIARLSVDSALEDIEKLIRTLQAEDYTHIYNLSYSPLSSHIVHALQVAGVEVSGYTRFSDGFLQIPDDASAYFYAQVGVGRFNRVHLTELFASVLSVELLPEDFDYRERFKEQTPPGLPPEYVVIHLGASQGHKCFPIDGWAESLIAFQAENKTPLVFVGASSENELFDSVIARGWAGPHTNLIGKTSFAELASVVAGAELLVGADSLPMQLASMLKTRSLNLSFSTVNFWETGPLAPGSRIIWEVHPERLLPKRLSAEMQAMLTGNRTPWPIIYRQQQGYCSFKPEGYEFPDFEWKLIQALYLEADFPKAENPLFLQGAQRLFEAVTLVLEQIPNLHKQDTRKVAVTIVEEVDGILLSLEKMVPSLQPLISWFQTERTRIGPGAVEQVSRQTEELFKKMQLVLAVYVQQYLESIDATNEGRGPAEKEEEFHG